MLAPRKSTTLRKVMRHAASGRRGRSNMAAQVGERTSAVCPGPTASPAILPLGSFRCDIAETMDEFGLSAETVAALAGVTARDVIYAQRTGMAANREQAIRIVAAVVRLTSDAETDAPEPEPAAEPNPAPSPASSPGPRGSRPKLGTCRLILAIGDDDYAVRPIAVDPGAGVAKALRLRKADGTVYDLAIFGHGPECDCPDFTFRRDGLDPKGCKHLRAARAAGLLN